MAENRAPLGLNFHLPKLKKDLALKTQKADPQSKANATQPKGDNTIAQDTAAVSDTASPDVVCAPLSACKPTTTRKSKRSKARVVSTGPEQSQTVYYDAIQSPDDASTRTQHKRGPARSREAVVAAAAASEAAGAETDMFATEPEPMEADNDRSCSDMAMHTRLAFDNNGAAARACSAQPSQQQDHQRCEASGQTVAEAEAGHRVAGADAAGNKRKNVQRGRHAAVADAAAAVAAGSRSQRQHGPAAAAKAAAEAFVVEDVGEEGRHEKEGEEQQQQQQQHGSAAAGKQSLKDGQEIFKYMQQLAEDAAELLPQEQEQKKRGRGRPKKDLSLVDALHQCWNGKSYYERLQEIAAREAEQEAQDLAAAAGPEYKPMHLQDKPAVQDGPALDGGSQQQQQQQQHVAHGAAASVAAHGSTGNQDCNAQAVRKRRTTKQGAQSAAEGGTTGGLRQTSIPKAGTDVGEAAEAPAAGVATDNGPGPNKRRATAGLGRVMHSSTVAAGAAAASAKGRRATIAPSASTAAGAAAAAAGSRSPLPAGAGAGAAGRLVPSSRLYSGLAWDSTPGAGGSTAAERPPWSVGGAVNASGAPFGAVGNSATAGAGAGCTTGGGGGCATGKADRSAMQKLQAAFDAKCDELSAAKDQLKELQELVAKLRQEQKAHPKAIQLLEKQQQALQKKLDAGERRQASLERDNEGLHDRLAKQEAEKAALQEQLTRSEKEVKVLRLKLKQASVKLDKCQAVGLKLQEMGALLVSDAQPVAD